MRKAYRTNSVIRRFITTILLIGVNGDACSCLRAANEGW